MSIEERIDTSLSQRSTAPYARRVEKPWGWELHWTPVEMPYMGKLLHINAGARLSLQSHDVKQESWLLSTGRAKVVWEDETGALIETELQTGVGYTCPVGRKHRLIGITDCDVIEVSTPEVAPPRATSTTTRARTRRRSSARSSAGSSTRPVCRAPMLTSVPRTPITP